MSPVRLKHAVPRSRIKHPTTVQLRSLFCVLTTKESRAKIWRQLNAVKSKGGLGCPPFLGGGSVVVELLFYVAPIVCGGSVLVFVFICIALCRF